MKNQIAPALLLALGLTSAPAAQADTLREVVANLPPPNISSFKSLKTLQYCIGIGIADLTSLMTIDGDHEVVIVGGPITLGGMKKVIVIKVKDDGDRRTIAFHAHPSWDGRTESLIRACV